MWMVNSPNPSLDSRISRSDLFGEIVLGTSPVRYEPSNGEMKGFAIYAKELSPERHPNTTVAGLILTAIFLQI